jgi:hypothetical protein
MITKVTIPKAKIAKPVAVMRNNAIRHTDATETIDRGLSPATIIIRTATEAKKVTMATISTSFVNVAPANTKVHRLRTLG